MKNNELQNIENYNISNINNEIEIYMKYTNVIIQFLLFGIETIKNHNLDYIKYILIKGLFTISYVFKMLLIYSCNLDLTYHHCQKSYSYYIEFIGQIGDDSVTYLQLNSKDAALFVYKKTIFEIPDEIKKKYYESKVEENKNKTICLMIDILNKLIEMEIMQFNFDQLKTTEVINKMYNSIGHINSQIHKLYYAYLSTAQTHITDSNNTTNNSNSINNISPNVSNEFLKKLIYIKNFCDIIILKKTNMLSHESEFDIYKDYIKTIEYFIKKIRKTDHLVENFDNVLIKKSISIEFEEKIKLYNPLKFINWIFTPIKN